MEWYQLVALPEQEASLQDGAGARPSYNLRTLCRALEYARATAPVYGLPRALYDGGAMSFSTQLAAPSAAVLHRLLHDHFLQPRATDVCFPRPLLPSPSCEPECDVCGVILKYVMDTPDVELSGQVCFKELSGQVCFKRVGAGRVGHSRLLRRGEKRWYSGEEPAREDSLVVVRPSSQPHRSNVSPRNVPVAATPFPIINFLCCAVTFSLAPPTTSYLITCPSFLKGQGSG